MYVSVAFDIFQVSEPSSQSIFKCFTGRREATPTSSTLTPTQVLHHTFFHDPPPATHTQKK